MNFRVSLLLCCLLFLTHDVSAQGFLRTYTPASSTARDVAQAADGGFLLAGDVEDENTLFLLRTDAAGNTVWTRHLSFNGASASSVCPANDGGWAVLLENYSNGGNADNAVLKINANGDTEWLRVIENPFINNGLRDLLALPDGHFLAVGNTYLFPQGARNTAFKLAPDGTVVWQKSIGTQFRQIRRAILLPNGDFVVSGHGDDFYLARMDAAGFLVWEQSYAIAGGQVNYDLLLTTDEHIALLGTSPGTASGTGAGVLKISILKADLNGQMQWHKNYYPFASPPPGDVPKTPVVNTFCQDTAGHFYLPFWGYLDDPFDASFELLDINASGDVQMKHALNVSGNAWQMIATQDNHLAIAGDNNGFPTRALLLKTDHQGEYLNNVIAGTIFRDSDLNCNFDTGEPGFERVVVRAENAAGEVYYKNTQSDGSFEIRVSEGEFSLSLHPVYGLPAAYAVCDTPIVTLTGSGQTAQIDPVGVQVLAECPLLEIALTGGMMRRCTPTTFTVSWCNTGNQTAENAYVELTPDTLLSYLTSTLPLVSQNGAVYRFDLPDVPPGACGSFSATFLLACHAALAHPVCIEAHIYPDTVCWANPDWDGAVIEVNGACNGAEIEFNIKNTGTGNMAESAEYVIIEDQIMYMQTPVQLNAGESMTTLRVPMPDDSCFALRIFPNQTSLFAKPVAVVANCASPDGNLQLLLSLPSNDHAAAQASFCRAVTGSYDPNDKTGFPLGMTEAHYIERGDEMFYTLRFQNTGNDTAFLVVLRDTLPATLDPATLRPQGASHPFIWELNNDGVLVFSFPQIMLPDSTSNEPASHGFVSFRIGQQPGLPDGTLIENTAHIYFDFNEAVVTNTTWHTIGRPAVVGIQTMADPAQNLTVNIAPHPVTDFAHISLQGETGPGLLRFVLFDSAGKPIREASFYPPHFLFNKHNLPEGLYFWQISRENGLLARGKLLLLP
jgi:uncharacterized repeat protein (TIGR01451 family)